MLGFESYLTFRIPDQAEAFLPIFAVHRNAVTHDLGRDHRQVGPIVTSLIRLEDASGQVEHAHSALPAQDPALGIELEDPQFPKIVER